MRQQVARRVRVQVHFKDILRLPNFSVRQRLRYYLRCIRTLTLSLSPTTEWAREQTPTSTAQPRYQAPLLCPLAVFRQPLTGGEDCYSHRVTGPISEAVLSRGRPGDLHILGFREWLVQRTHSPLVASAVSLGSASDAVAVWRMSLTDAHGCWRSSSRIVPAESFRSRRTDARGFDMSRVMFNSRFRTKVLKKADSVDGF